MGFLGNPALRNLGVRVAPYGHPASLDVQNLLGDDGLPMRPPYWTPPIREQDGSAVEGPPSTQRERATSDAEPGQDPLLNVLGPRPEPRRSGFFGPDFSERLARAAALMQGDYRSAALISKELSEGRQAVPEAQRAWDNARRVASLPGMTERELLAYLANPDQWGAHMSDALSTHQAAANVGQTETRVFGDPTKGGHIYQPPRLIENGVDQIRYDPTSGASSVAVQGQTDGEQYARSLGLDPSSQEWKDAVRDQMLKGSGPTAHLFDVDLETIRQANRIGLEGTRQANRIATAGAKGSNRSGRGGDGGIVDVQTPEQARRLPKGTRFRTPDGRIKVR